MQLAPLGLTMKREFCVFSPAVALYALLHAPISSPHSLPKLGTDRLPQLKSCFQTHRARVSTYTSHVQPRVTVESLCQHSFTCRQKCACMPSIHSVHRLLHAPHDTQHLVPKFTMLPPPLPPPLPQHMFPALEVLPSVCAARAELMACARSSCSLMLVLSVRPLPARRICLASGAPFLLSKL